MRVQRLWPLIGGVSLMFIVASCTHGPSAGMATEWEAPTGAAGIRNPLAAGPESIVAGKAIYQRECLACHGSMGKGNGPAAIFLEPLPADLSMPMMRDHSDGALFWKITEGRRPMPSFEKRLAGDQRWQVVNYIRTLAAHPEGSAGKMESKDTAPMGHMH